jgi:hypothetical protein
MREIENLAAIQSSSFGFCVAEIAAAAVAAWDEG